MDGDLKSCPATVLAVLGFPPPGVWIRCGLLDDGHKVHEYRITWRDEVPLV